MFFFHILFFFLFSICLSSPSTAPSAISRLVVNCGLSVSGTSGLCKRTFSSSKLPSNQYSSSMIQHLCVFLDNSSFSLLCPLRRAGYDPGISHLHFSLDDWKGKGHRPSSVPPLPPQTHPWDTMIQQHCKHNLIRRQRAYNGIAWTCHEEVKKARKACWGLYLPGVEVWWHSHTTHT